MEKAIIDQTIDDLPAAEAVTADDLFVAQQNGTAKKVSGDTLRKYVGQEAGLPKPDGAEEGAFLRIRDKKWVAEKSPVVIDLYSAGVDVNPAQSGKQVNFDVSEDIVAQFVDAVKNGGALLNFGVVFFGRMLAQAYFVGSIIEEMQAYQLSGKVYFDSSIVNVFFIVQLKQGNTQISSICIIEKALPNPENVDDGAFLRVESGAWVASKVPAAEGGTF